MKATDRVDIALLSEILGISESTAYRLQKQGVLKRRGGRTGGGFPLAESVQAYIASRSDPKAQEKEPEESIADLIAREKLRQLQTENARKQGELVPVSLIEDYARQLGSTVHDGLEALAGNIKKRVPYLRAADMTQVRSEIAKIANGIVDFHPRHKAAP